MRVSGNIKLCTIFFNDANPWPRLQIALFGSPLKNEKLARGTVHKRAEIEKPPYN
ncbi:hypothetical protein LguiB_020254 [Lonicera macranthoides]